MKSKIIHAVSAALVFTTLGLASLLATGRLNIGPAAPCPANDDCCPITGKPLPHAGAPGHNHKPAHADCPSACDSTPLDLDAVMRMNCEHRLIVDCDDCRYEVGLVKVGPDASALLETQTVSQRSFDDPLRLTGRVELDQARTFQVAAAAAGRVTAVEKFLGQHVKAGDVLAVIQSAELGRAKADWLEANAALELAQAAFAREKHLHEKQITSRAAFEAAQSELRRAEASLAAAEKQLNLLGLDDDLIAAIENDKTDARFARLVLRAPADGIVIEQNLVAGRLVESFETLYTIADVSRLWVWCDLYERDLPRIHEGLRAGRTIDVAIRVAALPDEVFDGTLDLIDGSLNAATRTVRLRLSIDNPDGLLKVGMFATARIAHNRGPLAAAVPATAVMADAGKTFVFQQVREDLWFRRNVLTGRRTDGYVEITDGLPHDATVAAKGAFMLKSDVLREKMGAGCAH